MSWSNDTPLSLTQSQHHAISIPSETDRWDSVTVCVKVSLSICLVYQFFSDLYQLVTYFRFSRESPDKRSCGWTNATITKRVISRPCFAMLCGIMPSTHCEPCETLARFRWASYVGTWVVVLIDRISIAKQGDNMHAIPFVYLCVCQHSHTWPVNECLVYSISH